MRLLGRFLTTVLVMAMILPVILTPASQGQGIATVTSVTTFTTPSTVTITKTVAIQETSIRTTTTPYSTTTYLTRTQTLRRETIILNTFQHPQYGCYYEETSLKAGKDQVLSINLTSTSEIAFFMVHARDWKEWIKTRPCSFGKPLVEAYFVTSYYTDFVIPEDGSYYFLFLNFSPDTKARVQFSAKIIGSAGEASSVITTTMVLEKSSTETETLVVTAIRTITSIRTEATTTETAAAPAVLTGIPFDTLRLGGLATAVVLISSVLVLMRRRKGPSAVAALKQKVELEPPLVKETPPVAPVKEPVVPEVKAPVRYCTNCGTEMLADALYCPTCASGTLSPASDRTLGVERLEHAAIQASVLVRHMEVKIGEDATIELQMINAGKKPATLVKIENVVPAGFELVSGPEPFRVVRDDLHLKGRRLDPMKTEEIELVLRPKRKGSFVLKPRIFYLDEDGNYRYHEPDPVTITVKEIGLRGWVTGPE